MRRVSLIAICLIFSASCSSDDVETTVGDGDGDGDGECPTPSPANTTSCGDGLSEVGELCLQFSGTYVPVDSEVAFAVSPFLATGDLDGDGNLDVVAHWQTMFGDGTGAFAGSVAMGGDGALTADFGRGDAIDLAWFDSSDSEGQRSRVLVKFGGADFTDFAESPPEIAVSLEWEAEQLDAGDFDGDGITDLIIVQRRGSDSSQHELIWARGLGDGQFEVFQDSSAALDHGDLPSRVTTGVLTADGRTDLLWRPTSTAIFLLGAPDGPEFAQEVSTELTATILSDSVIDRDIDCDANPDIVAARATGGFVAWVQLEAGFPALALTHDAGEWSDEPSLPVAVEDMNNDGHPDVLLITAGDVHVAIGEGGGRFSSPTPIQTPHPWIAARIADVDHDDHPDLIGLYDDISDPSRGEVIENAGIDVILTIP